MEVANLNFLKMLGMKPEDISNLVNETLGDLNISDFTNKINDFINAIMKHIMVIEENQEKILKKLDSIINSEGDNNDIQKQIR